ncbi:hypothetical protein [Halalkalibacter alkaliphilus]|uniref:Uncharacterized protein n=1 Tax=Halalkalibacter alkaliphilus TaxID=2917993 RepID=A0A9X2I6V3_9BACI|nr:hypothetical protein [Halalkalibacter alkaliphilus]MCL7749451.1 hypothetical protein [Halalkalibacter alkaliphilus]
MNHNKKWLIIGVVIVTFIVVNVVITNLTQQDEDRQRDVNPMNSNISTH